MNQTGWTAGNFLLRAQDGTVYPVTENTLIGREADCQIVLSHPRISRHHARLVQREGLVLVEDLRSSSGTFVNGDRIDAQQVLIPGDELRLEDIVLRLVAREPADTALVDTNTELAVPARPRLDTTYVLRADELALLNTVTRKDIGFLRPGAPGGPGLVVLSAPIRGKVLPLRATSIDASWLIGSDPNADIHLIDRAVSQQHSRIRRQGETWVIENLSVTNPLFVNGVEIGASSPLTNGDRLQLGRSELQFHTDCSNLATLPAVAPRAASGSHFLIGAAVFAGLALAAMAILALFN